MTAIEAIGATVSDLDRSLDFYAGLLGFSPVADEVLTLDEENALGMAGERIRRIRLRLGQEFLDLHEFQTGKGRPIPADSRSNDRWFQHIAIVVADMAKAYEALCQAGVTEVSPGPQRLPDWNPAVAGIEAFYFCDPDGRSLELLRFPADKGDPRWQDTAGRLFLGIDHTALVVADTQAALGFYHDRLGLRVAGEGLNHGEEQARLNAVPGVRLRITMLKAERGPAVELLEYLHPRDGRPMPADSRADDLWHWHIALAGGPQRPVTGLLRDPDGHAVLTTGVRP